MKVNRHRFALTTVSLYDYVYAAVKKHCLEDGKTSIMAFVNRSLCEALRIPWVPSSAPRPYYPRDTDDVVSSDALRIRKAILGDFDKGEDPCPPKTP